MDISTTYNSQFPYSVTGKARIVKALYAGLDPAETWRTLFARVSADPTDAAAFYDLSLILHTTGQPEAAATTLNGALSISRQFRIKNGSGAGMHVLVFVTAGNFMANTPIEFLLDASDTTVTLYHVDENTADLSDAPQHDVAFLAVGHSDANLAILDRMETLLADWPKPVVNQAAHQIKQLSRDGIAAKFETEPSILSPKSVRVPRQAIAGVAAGEAALDTLYDRAAFPIIVRPLDTHAGQGMEKIDNAGELHAYLGRIAGDVFYVCPFIDYRSADGRFRKQRIAFINGRAYPSHQAVSDHWMVHYLSAGMATHAERRAEEARWMETFDSDFALRHARAFDALHRHIGLDYFAVDCGELSDGRLLLFEADNAMIVHSMDSEKVFPYKVAPMRRLFAAFERALRSRVERSLGYSPTVCAHTGQPPVFQKTDNDCLIAVTAMFLGLTYAEVEDLALSCDGTFPRGGPMSHSIMRAVANKCGRVMLSSIYMLWGKPAIIGVVSPTIPSAGHAVLWDGEKIIDPGPCERVDRAYVDRCGLEFSQRAKDLAPLIAFEEGLAYTAKAVTTTEPL